jgi:HD-GYP domain-containing protein (c-di-GMP phosphodiesterase class II)
MLAIWRTCDPNKYIIAVSMVLVFLGLYLTSLYHYLLFHSLAEIFSIVVACGIFIVAWNTRRFLDNDYLLFIGIAYLFIGGLDLIHTLAYAGMGVFEGYDSNLPTQLWIATRYTESLSLLAALWFLRRRLKPGLAFIGYAGVISLLLASIFYWNIFPTSFIEGEGLTPFKKTSEYVISLILLGSLLLLLKNRSSFDRTVLQLLIASIIATICSELAFTFFIEMYGFSNLVGHLLKILSFYLIYKAIIETGLERPFDLLFRQLKQSEVELQEHNKGLENRVLERTAELAKANTELSHGLVALARAEEVSRRQVQRLQVLRSIDMAISSGTDLRATLDILLEQVVNELDIDAAAVLLINPQTQAFEYAAGRGFRTATIQHSEVQKGDGIAGHAVLERRTVSASDLYTAETDLGRATLIRDEAFVAHFATPLITKGDVKGILELFNRTRTDPKPDWLEFFETLAAQAAIAIEDAFLLDDLQQSHNALIQAYDSTLEGWVRAIDLRDKETEGHSVRVVGETLNLARLLNISDDELVHVRRGALLHDIGKLGIPDSILHKPGSLSDEEWKTMRLHPVYAHEFLTPITYLKPAVDIPYNHHERWDGTGYPRGLAGADIPLTARIFAIVDVWDALRSDRPYRPAWSDAKAREYIAEQSGKHFDPTVVRAFFDMSRAA